MKLFSFVMRKIKINYLSIEELIFFFIFYTGLVTMLGALSALIK